MTLVRLSLRLHRNALIGMAFALALIGYAQAPGYARVAGNTPATRALFVRAMEPVARQMSFMLPLPTRTDTLAGYIQWRAFGFFPWVLSFWAVLSAARATRGDEETGLTEQWLSTGITRSSWLFARVIGFALTTSCAVLLCLLGSQAGAASIHEPLSWSGLFLQGITLEVFAIWCFCATCLLAQFTSTRSQTAGIGASLIGALAMINAMARTVPALHSVRWISPFYLYDRMQAITPERAIHLGSVVALVVGAALCLALAFIAFSKRDLNAPVLQWRSTSEQVVRTPSTHRMVQGSIRIALYEQRGSLLFQAFSAVMISLGIGAIAHNMVQLFQSSPAMLARFALRAGTDPAATFLSRMWSTTTTLLLSVLSILQVGRWVAEDLHGRLELVLSTPKPRHRVIFERIVTLVLICTFLSVSSVVSVAVAASRNGLAIHTRDALATIPVLVLFGLTVGAFGAACSAFAPRITMGAMSILVGASYLVQQLGPLFQWPKWLIQTSLFELVGAPLGGEFRLNGVISMLLVSVLGYATSFWAMSRHDLGR